MKPLNLLLILLTAAFFLACSSDKETLKVDTNLTAYSEDIVKLNASGAKAYSWRQVSGTDVIIVDANSATASFIAPSVTTQETLVFELEALIAKVVNDDITLKKQVSVTVLPKDTVDNTDINSTSGEVEPEPITTTTQETNSSTQTTPTTPTNNTQTSSTLKSLKLTIEKTSLNIETNTTLKVVATYDDNTSKDVTDEVEWSYSDNLAISIQNHTLKTNHKDTNIFIQAKLNNITSNSVALEIYKEINGHRLPPEPDPAINNATLLGVDTNDNGVRDDVERWVYTYYSKPIEHAVMMQNAKAYQIVIQEPEKALETRYYLRDATACEAYWSLRAKREGKEFWLERYRVYEKDISPIQFNTAERFLAYDKYNDTLSGGSYSLVDTDEMKNKCDFNTTTLIKNP